MAYRKIVVSSGISPIASYHGTSRCIVANRDISWRYAGDVLCRDISYISWHIVVYRGISWHRDIVISELIMGDRERL